MFQGLALPQGPSLGLSQPDLPLLLSESTPPSLPPTVPSPPPLSEGPTLDPSTVEEVQLGGFAAPGSWPDRQSDRHMCWTCTSQEERNGEGKRSGILPHEAAPMGRVLSLRSAPPPLRHLPGPGPIGGGGAVLPLSDRQGTHRPTDVWEERDYAPKGKG